MRKEAQLCNNMCFYITHHNLIYLEEGHYVPQHELLSHVLGYEWERFVCWGDTACPQSPISKLHIAIYESTKYAQSTMNQCRSELDPHTEMQS
jgi:hypothetical protein